ncbi:hypothetical protein VPH35_128942 [Triticum aestivum]
MSSYLGSKFNIEFHYFLSLHFLFDCPFYFLNGRSFIWILLILMLLRIISQLWIILFLRYLTLRMKISSISQCLIGITSLGKISGFYHCETYHAPPPLCQCGAC